MFLATWHFKIKGRSFDLTGLHADSLTLNYKPESPEPAFRLKNLTAQEMMAPQTSARGNPPHSENIVRMKQIG